jgi:hypothetical protein
MGVRPDAPTIETIVPMTFYEAIKFDEFVKSSESRHCEERSDEAIS